MKLNTFEKLDENQWRHLTGGVTAIALRAVWDFAVLEASPVYGWTLHAVCLQNALPGVSLSLVKSIIR